MIKNIKNQLKKQIQRGDIVGEYSLIQKKKRINM